MFAATLPDLSHGALIEAVRTAAHPLRGAADDYDSLLEFIGDARFVLIGEASHGTHEFYRERAQITKRLIREKGFDAVAVEADWPDAYRVNRYVRGRGDDAEAIDAMEGFKRFPTWMWRNADVLDFVGWLRNHNDSKRPGQGQSRVLWPRPLQSARLDGSRRRLSGQSRPASGQPGTTALLAASTCTARMSRLTATRPGFNSAIPAKTR